jgi:SNF2 family DNA or RNA helicase
VATLKRVGDELHLNLKGHPDFRQALQVAKGIFPRTYDPEAKLWKYPASESMALRIMYSVAPQPDADVLAWVRGAATRIADELSSRLPQDAELYWVEGPRLFQFQRPMVDFMARQERVLNGDDMGLGKTIEAIGAVQEWIARDRSRRSHGPPSLAPPDPRPKLVIAGTSKLGDWKEEIEKWAPGAKVMAIPGDMPAAKRTAKMAEFERDYAPAGGWLVVNHEQIRALPEDKDAKARNTPWTLKTPWFAEQQWLAVIADEAHRFKNPLAQQTRGLWSISAVLKYALTGTPIINAPAELWAILAWLDPENYNEQGGPATTYWQFEARYSEGYPIPGRGRVVTGVKNGDDLRTELADKLARRSKRLLVELGLLPPKLPTKTRIVPMRKAQAKLYHEAERAFWLTIEQDIETLREQAAGRWHAGELEAQLQEAASAKLEKIEARLEAGEDISTVARLLPNAGAKHSVLRQIATSPALLGAKDESGKLDALIEDIVDAGEKPFVVFTWHRETAEIIVTRLHKQKISAEFMHGGTKQLERTEVVRRFEDGQTRVLVATIKTGGEGLNLVGTDMPLFPELSDRVTDNDQGEDRTWRLGQTNEVQPVRYLSEGTVETERQAPRLRMKEILLGATIGRDRD